MAIALKHQTLTQFAQRLHKRFANSTQMERGRIASWIYDRYDAGDLTVAQLRTAFSLDTDAKWTAFRDRLLALRGHYLAIKAEEAE